MMSHDTYTWTARTATRYLNISQEDDCIYHSDEDIPFGEEQPGDQEKVVGLSPIGTPNWSGE